jgi:hypothetical protein
VKGLKQIKCEIRILLSTLLNVSFFSIRKNGFRVIELSNFIVNVAVVVVIFYVFVAVFEGGPIPCQLYFKAFQPSIELMSFRFPY